MQLGLIGLGRMGSNLTLRLLDHHYHVVGYNRTQSVYQDLHHPNFAGATSLEHLVSLLQPPRVIWSMLSAGEPTITQITQLADFLEPGDTVIEGGNSFYQNTIKLGSQLTAKKINFIDVGVSGGPSGARHGACLMIGGDQDTYSALEPLFKTIAAPRAYQFFPGIGAGHFVKMVHNGIEYGMMQAIAEGFTVLKQSPYHLDLINAAKIYNNQSVIESRLISFLTSAFEEFSPDLTDVDSAVGQLGEGQWTVDTAHKLKVAVPIIEGSLEFRNQSAQNPSFTGKILTALRNQFGGHAAKK